MGFFLTDISSALRDAKHFIEMHPPLQPELKIKCGSVERLMHEIDRVTGRFTNDDNVPTLVAAMQFCGVPVIASDLVPDDIVVVLMGNEVVNIIKLPTITSPAHLDQPERKFDEENADG